MEDFDNAVRLLHEFKGNSYIFGFGVLDQAGGLVSKFGQRVALVRDSFEGASPFILTLKQTLQDSGARIIAEVEGARPNAPKEDIHRIANELKVSAPDWIIGFGGGSTLDAVKAAEILNCLAGELEDYFGTGLVTKKLLASEQRLRPILAIQTAASSASHLTKYSNITDMETGQKKLIVDDAVIPPYALFDHEVTLGAPLSLTADGALDGISHSLEVFYGSVGKPQYGLIKEVATEGIRLVVHNLPDVIKNPTFRKGRAALALATDLGGYSIMLGGTNGAHLNSFSFVDVLSHGRSCAILNPYYSVFFSSSIEDPLRSVGLIFQQAGYLNSERPLSELQGRTLGVTVAEAMLAFYRKIGVPTSLNEVPGFGEQHIRRALDAAKQPQLKMKLENMPIPLTPEMIDEYMAPVLLAAKTGNLEHIQIPS